MKKFVKHMTATAVLVTFVATTSLAFADTTSTNSTSVDGQNTKIDTRMEMPSTQKPPIPGQMGMVEFKLYAFAKADISKTDIELARGVLKSFMDSKYTLLKSESGSILITDLANLVVTYQANLTPYVDSAKLDAFNKEFSTFGNMLPQLPPLKMGPNGEIRGDIMKNQSNSGAMMNRDQNKNGQNIDSNRPQPMNMNGSGTMQPPRQNEPPRANIALPTSVTTALDAKLSTFSSDSERVTWLGNVNTKIDAILPKISSTKNRAILESLHELISQKIDSLNGVSSSDSLLNSILN